MSITSQTYMLICQMEWLRSKAIYKQKSHFADRHLMFRTDITSRAFILLMPVSRSQSPSQTNPSPILSYATWISNYTNRYLRRISSPSPPILFCFIPESIPVAYNNPVKWNIMRHGCCRRAQPGRFYHLWHMRALIHLVISAFWMRFNILCRKRILFW